MLVENHLVARKNIEELLREEFATPDSPVSELEFLPLGEDSWSYRSDSFWVSVRRDLDGHFPSAYEGARMLREAGMDFVLAPLPGRDGQVVHTVDGFPVVVFPYLDHVATGGPAHADPGALADMVDRLIEVHQAELDLDLPEEDFLAPFEKELEAALRTAVAGDNGAGPFSADLHQLVTGHWDRLTGQRAQFAELSEACVRHWEHGSARALTHGDPSQANVVLGPDLLILDWGGLMVSPPERDYAALSRAFGLPPRGRPEMLRFYELRWILAEVAEYTSRFVAPHTGDADDRAMWHRLLHYVQAG